MDDQISIIGLGKLGACMAGAFADKGYYVIGMDLNPASVEAVNSGRPPVAEPELEQLFSRNKERLRATENCSEAVSRSSQTFVIVPTPSLEDGSFSLEYVAATFHEIGKALKEKKEYHNVVLTSTVLPGSMRYGLLPLLENASGKRCGVDFGLCYSPLFIALGSVIRNFLYPDFTLIGEFDKQSGDTLEAFYRSVLQNDSPCKRMSIENAEITKVTLNTFITTKVAFANMISELCQTIPGGDVDIVTDALGTDSRIGKKYLKGGLGYGGPCFPRDNKALSFIAQTIGVKTELAEVTDTMNRQRPGVLLEYYKDKFPVGAIVAVLGLAYKPGTPVMDESQSVMLCELLLGNGFSVIAFDPLITKEKSEKVDGVRLVEDLATCLSKAQVVFVTTPEPEFADLLPHDFSGSRSEPVVVIDCWRILNDKLSNSPEIIYLAPGMNSKDKGSEKKLQQTWGHYSFV